MRNVSFHSSVLGQESANASQFTIEEENQKLLHNTQNGLSLANSGIVANLTSNPILKKAEKTVNNSTSTHETTSFTRNADIIEINKDLLAESRGEYFQTINAITNGNPEISRFRRKHVDYGNHNAMHEVISQKLYSLTGITSPDTKMMVSETEKRASGELEISIISPMIVGYKDLGDFLIDETAKRFINPELHDLWLEKSAEVLAINHMESFDEKSKMKRIKLLSEIYEMLPDYFHEEVEKAFAASKFIGNWDFANFNLNNIGCEFTFNNDHSVRSFRVAFVDFGNSGVIGFGGKYKELSLERANTEAKSKEKKPQDYDPALKLSEAEELLVQKEMLAIQQDTFIDQQNLRSKAINSLYEKLTKQDEYALKNKSLIRSIFFKASHQIIEQESDIKIGNTTGFLTIADLPRHLPFSFLLKKAIKQKTLAIADSQDVININQSQNIYRDSEIEMAFRLSLIPDEAIELVIKKWDLRQEYPQIFANPAELETRQDYSTGNLARIFIDRKNTLVKSIPTEIVNEWIERNLDKAFVAEESVKNAIYEQTSSNSSINEENSIQARNSKPISNTNQSWTITKIKKMLSEEQRRLKNEYSDQRMNLVTSNSELSKKNKYAIQKLEMLPTAETEGISYVIETLKENQRKLESETNSLTQEINKGLKKNTEKMMLEFIKKNVSDWNRELTNDNPSYAPLDLKRIIKKIKLLNPSINDSDNERSSENISALETVPVSFEGSILKEFIKTMDRLQIRPHTLTGQTASRLVEREQTNTL